MNVRSFFITVVIYDRTGFNRNIVWVTVSIKWLPYNKPFGFSDCMQLYAVYRRIRARFDARNVPIPKCWPDPRRPVMNPWNDCGLSPWWSACNQFTRIRRRHVPYWYRDARGSDGPDDGPFPDLMTGPARAVPCRRGTGQARTGPGVALLARQASFSVHVIAISRRRRDRFVSEHENSGLIWRCGNRFQYKRVFAYFLFASQPNVVNLSMLFVDSIAKHYVLMNRITTTTNI